jgi:sulfatase modifying factor 1
MSKIFLSYRRQDTAGITGRIYDRLRAHFGNDAVFMDIDSTPFGVDFREHIDEAVGQCDVVLVVIGTRWAGEIDAHRRIDDPRDFVRIEIESALQRDIPVIPLLIDHTRMPAEADLPPSLARLTYRNAIDVDQGRDFHPHVDRLIKGIAFHFQRVKVPAAPQPPKPPSPEPVREWTNSIGMKLVRIEAGEFLMGSTKDQFDKLMKQFPDLKREWFDGEQPQHPVKITRPFYLAAHPVTVGQFRRFVESTGYKSGAEKGHMGSFGSGGTGLMRDYSRNWKNPGFAQGDDHPVVCVSHNDAVAFLGWLNEQETEKKCGYRLPTEAQWEYASRAGTGGLYGGDDDPESLVRIANVADASLKKVSPIITCIRGDDGFVYTAPVGSFEPNAWHLYDMLGNVWEWCDDWYDRNFYQSSPEENPHNTAEASDRVLRGGGWSFYPGSCRPALRIRRTPGDRYYDLGFRVAAVQE